MFRFLFTVLFTATLGHAQSQQKWVDSLYTHMTLDQKIGQLFMVMAYPDGNASKRRATIKQEVYQSLDSLFLAQNNALIPFFVEKCSMHKPGLLRLRLEDV